jgi:hypothetical protein
MRNQLRYASEAFTVGRSPVDQVLFAAAGSMEHIMNKRAEKALQKAGLK